SVLFFFFQAEDGIRDKLVTGVQTCALPISRVEGVHAVLIGEDLEAGGAYRSELEAEAERLGVADRVVFAGYRPAAAAELAEVDRSEERRVGKECRDRGGADD